MCTCTSRAAMGAAIWRAGFLNTATLATFMAEAIKADEEITAGVTTLVPGDHCTFCPANPHGRGPRGRRTVRP